MPRKKTAPRVSAVQAPEDDERRFFDALYAEWIPLHDRRPATLYHYTNAQGLLGIVQSHRLWAGDARFLNDPSEIEYAANAIRESIVWVTKHYPSPLPNTFTRQVVADLDGFVAEARVYICCFCHKGDLLSQWRGYGAQGGGYSIGFDATDFGDREVSFPLPKPILRRVIYKPPVQQRLIRTWLQAACDLSAGKGLARHRHSGARIGWMNHLIFTFRMLLPEFLLCFKNPEYEEEQEWRLIQFGRVKGKPIIKPEFRASGGRILPYAILDLTHSKDRYKGKLPIQAIRFGPTLDPDSTTRSLQLLSRAAGYKPESLTIASSAIPFSG